MTKLLSSVYCSFLSEDVVKSKFECLIEPDEKGMLNSDEAFMDGNEY